MEYICNKCKKIVPEEKAIYLHEDNIVDRNFGDLPFNLLNDSIRTKFNMTLNREYLKKLESNKYYCLKCLGGKMCNLKKDLIGDYVIPNNEVYIKDENHVITDEIYAAFYECSNCGNRDLREDFSFCPGCGLKLTWDLSPSYECPNCHYSEINREKLSDLFKCTNCGYSGFEKDFLW